MLTADVTTAVAAALNSAVSVDEVAAAIFREVAAVLGSRSAGLWLLDDDGQTMHLVASSGFPAGIQDQVGAIRVSDEVPASDALRLMTPVVYSSRAERDSRWPHLAGVPSVLPSAVALPLVARERAVGVLGFGLDEQHELAETELAVLVGVSEQCALALDRARLFDAEREARGTLEFLANATRLIMSALGPHEVIERLVDAAVPRLAESCAVFVERGGELHQVAVRINGIDNPREILGDLTFDLHTDHPLTRAYTTGEPVLLETLRDEDIEAVRPGRAPEARAFGIAAGLAVPLVARGAHLGVVTFAFTNRDDVNQPGRIDAAIGFAARAALALDNARRFDDEHSALKMLTEALLPPALPRVPGYELAGRYVAATGTVGGDWYDAQVFQETSLLIGVGDIPGHGITAAAQMSELRQSARALALWRRRPRVLLNEMSQFTQRARAPFATVAYARLDLTTGRGRWASAGHPPAIHVHEGVATPLPAPHGPPLGFSEVPDYQDASIKLAPGDMLILYTDGVVERRGEDLADGIKRLCELATTGADETAAQVTSAIAAELCTDPDDDCCFLVLRRT